MPNTYHDMFSYRLYALAISLLSFVMLFHHILYFLGYRMGILQRVQVTAAIHGKPNLDLASGETAFKLPMICWFIWLNQQPCLHL